MMNTTGRTEVQLAVSRFGSGAERNREAWGRSNQTIVDALCVLVALRA
jgi:hypothetical protein